MYSFPYNEPFDEAISSLKILVENQALQISHIIVTAYFPIRKESLGLDKVLAFCQKTFGYYPH